MLEVWPVEEDNERLGSTNYILLEDGSKDDILMKKIGKLAIKEIRTRHNKIRKGLYTQFYEDNEQLKTINN